MIPLIVIRPQPGCDATVAAARADGLDAHGFPLFAVRPLPWDPPPPDSFDALLIGSANALRNGGAALAAWRGKPAYAVGASTAEAARQAGLDVIASGEGGLQALLAGLRPEHRRLLRLAGRERVALAPPAGITITDRVLYASEPLPLPAGLAPLLANRAVVLLHSAEAARHFAALCLDHGMDRARIALAAIGPRVAGAAGEGWAAIRAAAAPRDDALLALAKQMCDERPDHEQDKPGLMEDETLIQPLPMPPRPRRNGRTMALVALLTFVLGAGLAGWLVWSGTLAPVLPAPVSRPDAQRGLAPSADGARRYVPPQPAAPAEADPEAEASMSPLAAAETRLALLEDRFSRIDLQASAAAGNAARAEALLIAFAARRRIEGGEPLGYVEEQLKLRFSAAQPGAVDTIIATSRKPVTLAQLGGQLEVLAPQITDAPRSESGWARIRREVTSLFVVRRAAMPTATPQERVAHAKLLLASGKIEDAIAEVQRLPGAGDAQEWIADARRYDAARRALDLIETTAMLEPRLLRDASGQALTQPSPLVPAGAARGAASPAPAAAAAD